MRSPSLEAEDERGCWQYIRTSCGWCCCFSKKGSDRYGTASTDTRRSVAPQDVVQSATGLKGKDAKRYLKATEQGGKGFAKLQDDTYICGKKVPHWVPTPVPQSFKWLPKYNWKRDLRKDLMAGITTAIVVRDNKEAHCTHL